MPSHQVPLRCAEDVYRPIRELPGLTAPERCVAMFWPGAFIGGELRLPTEIAPAPVASVVANHGRWIVLCPFCPSAQVASRADHRFFCVECENIGDRRWLRVAWPEDAHEIEMALGRRPLKQNRNWEIGESVDDLRAENVAIPAAVGG